MSISRREFIRAGALGFVSAMFASCEQEQKSPQYQTYKNHVSQRGIGLPGGQILRYIEFSEREFESLNSLANSPLLVLGKDLNFGALSVFEEENKARMFANIVNKAGATIHTQYSFDSVNLTLYSNPQQTEFVFDSAVANALYGWVSSNQSLESSLYRGFIDQHILIGKFAVNPLNTSLIRSLSASTINKDRGIKTVLTVINTGANVQTYGTADTALVTELMQGYLHSGSLP